MSEKQQLHVKPLKSDLILLGFCLNHIIITILTAPKQISLIKL